MKTIKRISVIVIIFNLVRLFQGCNDFPQQIILFDLNKMNVSNIDNSGLNALQTESDTMFSEAVAFRIELSDTTNFIHLSALKPAGIGIFSCLANEPEPSFKPGQMIETIGIVSLFDISVVIPANTDVTAYFCYGTENYSVPGDLYLSWDQLKEILNDWSYDNKRVSFNLFFKENIQAAAAQFTVLLELSDGSTLHATTALIHLHNHKRE
jgi:hypothetical protein